MWGQRALAGLTRKTTSSPRLVLALAAAVLVLAAIVAEPVTGSLAPFSSDDPGSQSVAARTTLARASGVEPYFNLIALVPTPTGAGGAAAQHRIAAVEAVMRTDPEVARVVGPRARRASSFRAQDGRSVLVVGLLRAAPTRSLLDASRRIERGLKTMPGVKLGGLAAFYAQGNDLAREDLVRIELIAFPLLLLVALWVFRGVIAALLPLLIGVVTIVGTLAALRLLSEVMSVSVYALNIATALGLGLAVDYGLLIVSRYREELARSGPGTAAIDRTLHSAGRTVVMSSITVAAVMACLLIFPQAFLRSIGLGGVFVAFIAGISALVLLPAVLVLLRWRVNALTLPRWRRAAYDGAAPSTHSRWYRLSRLVMRRPVWIALISASVLLALAAPALQLKVTQIDANVMPRDTGARAVHDAIAANFPKLDASPVLIASQAPSGPRSRARLRRYARELGALPGASGVRGPSYVGDGVWQLAVNPGPEALGTRAQGLVRSIRSHSSPYPVLVGGETASLIDLKHSLDQRLPLALALIVLVTTGAVFLVTRSLVLPIKALLMNLLTITAVLGALVLIFQHGALEQLLGYTSSQALEPSTIVLTFALAIGLTTDYGIFLLSRIKEMRDAGASDNEAVALGLERTGRIVTAAALLLCIAMGSLITARHALVKEVGFGAALAVALDATLVRALLLPALMRLLGPINWWAPAWLRAGGVPPRIDAPRPPRPPSSAAIAGRQTLWMQPGRATLAGVGDALAVGFYCDHEHPAIRARAAQLARTLDEPDPVGIAIAAFEFVRDRIAYKIGPWGVPASTTLALEEGTCTNKANLLAALLRASGIPAAYAVLRVNARDYFGTLGPDFLTRYISRESVHIYAAAHLNGRWVRCDPSTDRELAGKTAHYCLQTRLVEWDGVHDSLDFLDPRHIYADIGLYVDIDPMLERPARHVTPRFMAKANDWLAFIRSEPPYPSEDALVSAYRAANRPPTPQSSRAAAGAPAGLAESEHT
jgi:RND superfamily putative drug exporter